MKKAIAALACFALAISAAVAGGRGGHSTTFDSNLFPGATITTINCTGSDSSSFSTWRTNSIAANPTQAVLRLTGNCVVAADTQITTGITNPVIWGYGATLNRAYLGSVNAGVGYLINAASAGATTVTLNTAADSSHFTVGGWMLVNGLLNQATDCGFPTNTAFFDYVVVTNINAGTGVITFGPPLTSNYLTTWPATNCSPGGQANAIPMTADWNTNLKIYGLTINDTGQVVFTGRTLYMLDSVINTTNGLDPTIADTVFVGFTNIGSAEIDKMMNGLMLYRVSSPHTLLQSASIKNFTVGSSNITWLQGTPASSYIYGSIIPTLWIGPTGYGAGNSVTVDGVTSSTAVAGAQFIAISALTWDSLGNFSLAKTDPNISVFYHMGVTGHKYAFGEANFSPFASPTTTFTINSITDDGSNIIWHTDLAHGALPTPTCGGPACTKIVSYPAATITQINTPTINLTQYAAP